MKISRKIQRQVELVIRHAMTVGGMRPEHMANAERESQAAKSETASPSK
jgi:hypothetical protein